MEIRHLRYFLAVAEAGNFTRAAERSFVAQSALSEQIARLETELGTKLFHRNSRRVSLTPAGETFQPLAARIVSDVEHALAEMSALTGLRTGRLRLGIIHSSAGPVDLIDLIGSYQDRYPGIDLTVRSGASADMAAEVVRGQLDLAIVASSPDDLPTSLIHSPIGDDPLVAVLPRRAAAGAPDPISLADLLARGRFIHFLPGSGLRTAVGHAFDRAGLAVQAGFEVGTISDMIRLAAGGLGVTIVPDSSAQREIAGTTLDLTVAILRLSDTSAVHPVGVVHDPARLSAAAAAFLQTLPVDRGRADRRSS